MLVKIGKNDFFANFSIFFEFFSIFFEFFQKNREKHRLFYMVLKIDWFFGVENDNYSLRKNGVKSAILRRSREKWFLVNFVRDLVRAPWRFFAKNKTQKMKYIFIFALDYFFIRCYNSIVWITYASIRCVSASARLWDVECEIGSKGE